MRALGILAAASIALPATVERHVEDLLRRLDDASIDKVLEVKCSGLGLAAGEERDLTFTLRPSDLAHLTPSFERIVEECDYEVVIGSSSTDIRLCAKFEVTK